jgi:lipoprotein-anchoring transpeptidase ErfK/SrfK
LQPKNVDENAARIELAAWGTKKEMRIRPFVIAAGLALTTVLSGCMTGGFLSVANYGATTDAGYSLPAIPITKVPQEFRRTTINLDTPEKPGTIIVDTGTKHLYFILPEGQAIRYGIGVGREGFEWHGTAHIALKREWPVWTPPAAMIRRKPELAKWRGGMPPGPGNALGARAMYLFNKGGDSGYRLHGTPEWFSIGKAMSSGCIRLMNQDIIDLYDRAEVGAKVIVR